MDLSRGADIALMSTQNWGPGAYPASSAPARSRGLRARLSGGGTDGNEQLNALTGVTLIVLFAVLGLTILRIGQLISVHLFVGLLLMGPVALKLASTGYRFVRYYARAASYREKGPPAAALRTIAPVVVASTFVVFLSGVLLLFDGPSHRGSLVLIHKASFIVWIAFTALHVLGHLPGLPATMRAATRLGGVRTPGASGRWLALVGGLVAGLVLAVVLIPDFSAWTAAGAMHHHDH